MSRIVAVAAARCARAVVVNLTTGVSSAICAAMPVEGGMRSAARLGARLFFPSCMVDRCGMWQRISLIRLIRVVIKS
jgi:hypothetical protein